MTHAHRPAPFTAELLFADLAPDVEPIAVQLRLDWYTSSPVRLARAQQILTLARLERWNAFEWWQVEQCAEAEAAYVRGLQAELEAEAQLSAATSH